MPIVKYIGGRESDVLYSTERGRVGSAAIATALYVMPERFSGSQIEQIGKDSFIFRYLANGGPLSENEKAIICEELHKRLGNSVKINLAEVDSIPKGPAGKSCLIIGLKREKDGPQ